MSQGKPPPSVRRSGEWPRTIPCCRSTKLAHENPRRALAMKRALCIWLPIWPLQRLLATRPELKDRGVVFYETPAQGGLRVVVCSPAAQAQGIVPGMPLAEAKALARRGASGEQGVNAELHWELYDPLADRLALEQLAECCRQFSPTVGLEEAEHPDSLLLDTSGLAPLFGGEIPLAEQVERDFRERGWHVRLALADTLGAAWAAAHYAARPTVIVPSAQTLSALVSLPVAALRLPEESLALLAELGLRRIADVAALPRGALLSRFGPKLLARLDQAAGLAGEAIAAQKQPPEFDAERLLEYPTERRETIDVVLEQLIARVAERLARERKGVVRLECGFDFQAGPQACYSVGLFRPSASTRHLLELVQLRLETVRFREPVCGVRVAVNVTAPLQFEQRELFAEGINRRSPGRLAVLIDRLSSRLDREAVLRPQVLPEAQPEYACRYLPLAGTIASQTGLRRGKKGGLQRHAEKKRRNKKPAASSCAAGETGERPLHLRSKPAPLSAVSIAPEGPPVQFRFEGREHRIAAAWGPERIETGWWRTTCVRRDYYRVETTTGQRFWLFCRLPDGQWFLHGEFA